MTSLHTKRRALSGDTPPRPPVKRALQAAGWVLVAGGALTLLYVVYLLLFTNITTDRAQQQLLDQWEVEVGALPGEPPQADSTDPEPVEPGEGYAALWFERDGERIVHDEVLYVVEGVDLADLRSGPGHYPDTVAPGGDGNFGVSGHRTTYGAPFYHLDRLEPGDEVHVVDRANREWVYVVREQRVVAPTDVWVVEDDPLGDGQPLLTLTTCHPRFSAAQRLIVFAELEGEA